MHCLPPNIGQEVTNNVINGEKSIVWKQAKNRLNTQKKILNYINWSS